MFDVGFWEMAFIGVIALVVIGPERLPKFAKTAGFWIGKGRRMINDVKSDIKKEMNEGDLKTFRDLKGELTSATDNVKNMAGSASESFGIKEAAEDLKSTIDVAKSDVSREVETLDGSSASSVIKGSKKSPGEPGEPGEKAAKKRTKKKSSKKTASTKTAVKKTTTKKATAKKTASKKSASRKTASKKTAAKKKVAVKSESVTAVEPEMLRD